MTIVFDGVALGALLFLISVGLSVTLGLMRFVNLAHSAFAMLGGYATVMLAGRWQLPFPLALPVAFCVSAAAGVVLERLLYRRLYGASHLDQVLFSIGLTFMAVAAAHYFFGAGQQPLSLPPYLRGQWHVAGADLGIYRIVLVVIGLAIAGAVHWLIAATRFGARLRAAVDNRRIAAGLGIDIDRVYALAFALGSGLAGLGGALGIEVLGLDPGFALKYLVYCLIIVAVGGSAGIGGPLAASLVIGVLDATGKYYLPQSGAFIIYAVMLAMLIVRPHGLFGAVAK